MRIAAVFLIIFVAFAAHAATFSNDSDSIDIDYIPGSDTPQGGGGGGEAGGGGGGGGENGGGGSQGGSQGSGSGGGEEGSSEVTVAVTAESDSGSGGGAGADSPLSGSDIVNTLLGNQALGFSDSSGNGGSGEGSAFGTVRLSGEDLREALRARGISKLSISLLSNRFLTRGDFAVAAASSLLENKAIEDVVMSAESFQLSYKAEGRLFAVFPMHYTVKLTINPRAGSPDERVKVKLPWYRFFLQTFFSKQQLQQELDAIIASTLAEGSVDERTRLFLAITTAIQKKVDTVSGSL